MAGPQMEDGFVGVAREIWDEMLCRKFTERQQKILKLIIRLSYGCKKKAAHIPLLKYFELCGVRIQNAKETIDYLHELHVIRVENDNYSINKQLDEWNVPYVSGWDEESFKKIIHLNLKPVTKLVSDSELQSYQKSNLSGDETYQKGNFSENGVTKKVTSKLPKRLMRTIENADGSKSEEVPKDSIKDIKILKTLKDKDNSESRNKKNTYSEEDNYYQMSIYFHNRIMEYAESINKVHLVENANLQKWCDEFRKICELDKRDKLELKKVIDWCTADPFWQQNILSPSKLREKYVDLALKMDSKPKPKTAFNRMQELYQEEEDKENEQEGNHETDWDLFGKL